MARLYIFAEGQTEQTFAHDVIRPHLSGFNVHMEKPLLIAHSKKKGKVHRGGGRTYIPMKNDIVRLLKQEKRTDVFFTTMIDLYAIHSDFPGLEESQKLSHLPQQRVEFLEQQFANDIGDRRFIPYLQLHEYEAYLFSKPDCFDLFYDHHASEITALKNIADQYETPELINDGPHSAPSKRIIALFPDYKGAKSVIGTQVAELIGLDTIRGKCPHFATWLSRLESLNNNPAGS